MIADLEIQHRGDWVLGRVADGVAAGLAQRFDQLIFAENLRVADASDELYELVVLGEGAIDALSRARGVTLQALADLPESWQLDRAGGFVSRSGGASCPVFAVIGATEGRVQLVERLEASGASPVDEELIDALRIAAGRPAWGAELTEQVIPLEAGLLDRAISTTKGCYVGQEIVIRMLHRGGGRVAKRLVTLEIGAAVAAMPVPGPALVDAAGSAIGTLTSIAPSLASAGFVALGYLRTEHAEMGTRVAVRGTDAAAIVTGFGG